MSKRPAISAKDKVTVAIIQVGYFPCVLCGKALKPEDKRVLEHLIPRAWTEADDLKDLAWVHEECADKKTYGNAATCADGDIHKIAKAKRLAKAREELKAVISGEKQKTPGSIKSRGFDKTWRKKMNGQVEKR